jgi:hypothetical protein
MQADKWLVQPYVSWYYGFNFWLPGFGGKANQTIDGRIPPDQFYPWLHEFLQDEVFGKYFTYDIVFDPVKRLSTIYTDLPRILEILQRLVCWDIQLVLI